MTERDPILYDVAAMRDIQAWKNKESSVADKARGYLDRPGDRLGRMLTGIPGAGRVMDKTIGSLVHTLTDLAHWSVRTTAIYRQYKKYGLAVEKPGDIHGLDLIHVDRAIKGLKGKYLGLAAAEGAVTGLVGLPGIPADIVAVVSLNQRAVAEYASYLGFDLTIEEERLFAMTILDLAAKPSGEPKKKALAHSLRLARHLAADNTILKMPRNILAGMVEQIARAMGLRLTRAKLIQFMPFIGAGAAAGLNALYTSQVCEAAYYLYRERFLNRQSDVALTDRPDDENDRFF
jgi:hypothetical protein